MTQEALGAANSPAQTSFLFPTAPAVQDRRSEPTAADTPPAPVETKPAAAASGLSTPLIVALVTGAITVIGSLAVIVVTHVYDRKTTETKAQQGLRHEILTAASEINTSLRATRKAVIINQWGTVAMDRPRYNKAVGRWYEHRIDLVDRTQTAFGNELARRIDASGSMTVSIDTCGVTIIGDDHDKDTHCTVRLAHEVTVLTARRDAINAKATAMPATEGVVIPDDFTTSLTIANTLLDRVLTCKTLRTGPLAAQHALALQRCPDLDNLQKALNLRVNLVGVTLAGIQDALPKD